MRLMEKRFMRSTVVPVDTDGRTLTFVAKLKLMSERDTFGLSTFICQLSCCLDLQRLEPLPDNRI